MGGTAQEFPAWSPPYLPPNRLRAEVDAMVSAIAGALVDMFGSRIARLWFKGSARKPWDSPIDYVPELSDVDIHMRAADPNAMPGLRGPNAMAASLADLDTALALHADIERRFREQVPSPLHTPRLQVMLVNELERQPGFAPSPAAVTTTLWGPDEADPTGLDFDLVRAVERDRLVEAADPEALAKIIGDLVERPGHHLYAGLRALCWRVSPAAPRVLALLGHDHHEVWSANRTQLVAMLHDSGHHQLARSYRDWYLEGWRAFLSGWTDDGAARAAFRSGVEAVRQAAAIAIASASAPSRDRRG